MVGWYKDYVYKRLDFIDHNTNTRYYCTKGNDCTYCRAAPHAKSKDDCVYVKVETDHIFCVHDEPVTKKREGGLAKCEDCGVTLIAPYDGHPYYCQECSQMRDRDP